jgi:hypothetical protein
MKRILEAIWVPVREAGQESRGTRGFEMKWVVDVIAERKPIAGREVSVPIPIDASLRRSSFVTRPTETVPDLG